MKDVTKCVIPNLAIRELEIVTELSRNDTSKVIIRAIYLSLLAILFALYYNAMFKSL